ncbi:D(1A) dopamine receptor-like [Dendronephthya gigantea]|uniref:D(1A) dopamine receptor-like n=1 Tax=Dendronephthya gigantea TaxID=151771 RepID=UPI00106D141A|nr:D(1A) dopamine receptor-like [Dendronephthya gigantea]
MANITDGERKISICLFYASHLEISNHNLLNIFMTNRIVQLVFLSLLLIATVLLNGISVVTILNCPQLKSKISYFLILVQSGADLVVAMTAMPIHIWLSARHIAGITKCMKYQRLFSSLFDATVGISFFSLCAMTYDRYMGVLFPFRHRTTVTKKKLVKFQFCSVMMTSVMIAINSINSFTMKLYHIFSTALVLICFSFIAFAYIKIFFTARRETLSLQQPVDIVNQESGPVSKRKRRFLRELKLAKSCFLVVLAFLLSFAPPIIWVITRSKVKNETVYVILELWHTKSTLINTSVNSLLFFWAKPKLRIEAANLFRKLRG